MNNSMKIMLGTGLHQSKNRCDIKGGGIMCDLKIMFFNFASVLTFQFKYRKGGIIFLVSVQVHMVVALKP